MRWWRGAWLVGIVLGMGCFHVDCAPADDCPGHAIYPGDWNLSECECPLQFDLRNLDGKDCTREGLTCVDEPTTITCTCVHMPAGARIWQCGTRDMAVPTIPVRDLAPVGDDGGLVDGGVSD